MARLFEATEFAQALATVAGEDRREGMIRTQPRTHLRVKHFEFAQGFVERMLDLGDIVLFTTDASTPTVTLSFIKDADGVREKIRRLVEARRDAKRVRSLDIGNEDAAIS